MPEKLQREDVSVIFNKEATKQLGNLPIEARLIVIFKKNAIQFIVVMPNDLNFAQATHRQVVSFKDGNETIRILPIEK